MTKAAQMGVKTPAALHKARDAAGVSFQFRDLRAKAATDTDDLAHAQRLLGHKNRSTTEIYTRERKGDLVRPLQKIVENTP
ncbi:MAG TPA: hypothetical protein VJ652_08140 [Noviherbaspirillum sp.]|nr:hypothetical protein [Noviherbaspirillum sp.]